VLKDFDVVKKQLGELADVVNKFKSEAVQLRLLELVFSGATGHSAAVPAVEVIVPDVAKRRPKRSKGRKAASAAAPDGAPKSTGDTVAPKKKTSSGNGAIATLAKIYANGFFSTPRTLNDILDHCDKNLARRIKGNEISGKLARMVRAGELTRVKNGDAQYEYTKP